MKRVLIFLLTLVLLLTLVSCNENPENGDGGEGTTPPTTQGGGGGEVIIPDKDNGIDMDEADDLLGDKEDSVDVGDRWPGQSNGGT